MIYKFVMCNFECDYVGPGHASRGRRAQAPQALNVRRRRYTVERPTSTLRIVEQPSKVDERATNRLSSQKLGNMNI